MCSALLKPGSRAAANCGALPHRLLLTGLMRETTLPPPPSFSHTHAHTHISDLYIRVFALPGAAPPLLPMLARTTFPHVVSTSAATRAGLDSLDAALLELAGAPQVRTCMYGLV